MKPVFFLDLGGVLAEVDRLSIDDYEPDIYLDCEKVQRLRTVVEECDGIIVLTSTWRRLTNWFGVVRRAFFRCGWQRPPLWDRTPAIHEQRGEEIRSWMRLHAVDRFVIIDDVEMDDIDCELRQHFVHCDSAIGFSESDMEKVRAILLQKSA